ncbi:MAG: DUF3396 domain-containing protein [Deltaproteobacteria bacterium]|nr:DUF3396 domain-containing protein [Deltaproteobacteria bacterium]
MTGRDRTVVLDPWQRTPVALVRPGIEILLALQHGDDPGVAIGAWEQLVDGLQTSLPVVEDNREHQGRPRAAQPADVLSLRRAFHAACRGPDPAHPIAWAIQRWLDADDPDHLPEYAASCSLGWTSAPSRARGCSLVLTVPADHDLDDLVARARAIAVRAGDAVAWATVGPRFVRASLHGSTFDRSLPAISARARRLLGVDVGDPFGLYATALVQRLRTVSWMTVLGPELAAVHADSLPDDWDDDDDLDDEVHDSAASRPFEQHQWGPCRAYQAGARPSLGDVNRGETLSDLRALDSHLRGVRASTGIHLMPPWDADSSAQWLERLETDTPWAEAA